MIDNLSILFALSVIVWVVSQAAILNKVRPWYEKEDPKRVEQPLIQPVANQRNGGR